MIREELSRDIIAASRLSLPIPGDSCDPWFRIILLVFIRVRLCLNARRGD
jgi:hypothetical protein